MIIIIINLILIFFIRFSIGWDAIIHIGPHKTGSTQLQESLVANEKVFEKFGFFRVTREPTASVLTHKLSPEISKVKSLSEIHLDEYNRTVDNIRRCDRNVILSHESFDFVGLEGAQNVASLFACYNVTIVSFYRQPMDAMRSQWCQINKLTRFPEPISETFLAKYLGIVGSDRMHMTNLVRVLDVYAQLFGRDHVRVMSFEGALRRFGSVFGALLWLLQLPPDDFTQVNPIANKSPSTLAIDTVRALGDYVQMTGRKFSTNLHKIHDEIATLSASLPNRTLTIQTPMEVIEADKRLRDKYKPYFLEEGHEQASPFSQQLDVTLFDERKLRQSTEYFHAWTTLVQKLTKPTNLSKKMNVDVVV